MGGGAATGGVTGGATGGTDRPYSSEAAQRLAVDDSAREDRSINIAEAAQTEEFYAGTRQSIDKAMTLPPLVYSNPEISVVERANVWERAWTCVGVTTQIAKHGDTIQRRVGTENIIITRDKKGTLRAFKNVCRHRGAVLVRKDGRYPILSCQYHRWGYSLDGRLVAAPLFTSEEEKDELKDSDMKFDPKDYECAELNEAFQGLGRKEFNKNDFPLIPVRLEVFGHLIFVNIDSSAPPLLEYLGGENKDGGLPEQIKEYLPFMSNTDPKSKDPGLISVRSKTISSKANWKLLVENFMEYYHLPSVHPSLCAVSAVDDHHRTQVAGNHTSFVTRPISKGGTPIDPHVLPHFEGLGPNNNQTAWFHCIFPNVFWFLLPHSVFTVIVSPDYKALETDAGRGVTDAVGMTIEQLDLSVSKEALDDPDAEAKIEEMWRFYFDTNDEDIDICQTVQEGIKAKGYEGGRFSFRFEETIHRFQNIYVDHMIGAPRVVPGDSEMAPGSARGISI
eukprot:CAMPEP_0167747372 /NCGR_PEP_ID=MMETSP0110_2-20121227/4248_1 /TAXON_ID=629695 /ORGANISM="Gymnochlora sp., Strain CCMP2014" /LENGTH=504 /DNA_ID=CAMNT_0007632273 /DNA_START=195 /DNA_END=1709 /DNA_ORIENTATION=+